jgi:hypothetical protein
MANNNNKLTGMLTIMGAVRDAQTTRGAQRELLMALCLRANPKRKYSCFPSYATLAEDTQLHVVTLKRAAGELESAGLIKRFTRVNKSNVFLLNIALILEQARKMKEEKAEKKRLVACRGEFVSMLSRGGGRWNTSN